VFLGERPVCGTCQQNKHECAGYGPDADPALTEANKEAKKTARRESIASANPPPVSRPAQDAPLVSPVPSRASLPHGPAAALLSPNLDSSSNASLPKTDGELST
jgi:hypothetical protein